MALIILVVTQAPRPDDPDSQESTQKNGGSQQGRSRSNTAQSVHSSPHQPLQQTKVELTGTSPRDDLLHSLTSSTKSSNSSPRTPYSRSPYGSKIGSPLAPNGSGHPLINDIFPPTMEETPQSDNTIETKTSRLGLEQMEWYEPEPSLSRTSPGFELGSHQLVPSLMDTVKEDTPSPFLEITNYVRSETPNDLTPLPAEPPEKEKEEWAVQ